MSRQHRVVESSLSRRYARALFRVLKPSTEGGRTALASLTQVAELFANKMAGDVLLSPVMPVDLKKNLLAYGLKTGGSQDPQLANFFNTLADAGRVAEIPAIIRSLTEILNSQDGTVIAEVTSVVPLGEAQLQELRKAISPKHRVELSQKTDPQILGGMIIKVGHKVLDLSLKSRLTQLTQVTSTLS